VTVYGIGIGGVAGISLNGERLMNRLADETGGQSFFPPREQDLERVYDLLATDAQNRYLLTYTPNNQKQDGLWRPVSVAAYSKALSVTARPGYFAPEAPPVRPTIEFAVTDTASRFVDVTTDDLVVVEDGVEQKVETFQDAVTPVSVILALDASGSMKKSAEAVAQAARGFVEALPAHDNFALVLFANKSMFAHDLTTVREWSFDAIDDYVADGGTALYDALTDSLVRLRSVKGRRALVVMTDGRDENNAGDGPGSRRTFNDVRDRLRETDTLVFPIGLGSRVDKAFLSELAAASGGQAYFPQDVEALREEYRRVLENLRRRYILGYTSTNKNRDGSWRKVEIKTRRADTKVNSRGGYFAPAR
jgi:VWFA-related protein